MTVPIALQLHTVREALEQDFRNTLTRVAKIGYSHVECGLDFFEDRQKLQILQDLGLQIAAVHIILPIDEKKRALFDAILHAGVSRLVVSWLPEEEYQSKEKIEGLARQLNAADEIVRQHGLTLGIHNHWWEFRPTFNGSAPFEILSPLLNDSIFLELDVYWAQTGGNDPVALLAQPGFRAPLLHLKDGPAENSEQPMTALGEGRVDILSIVTASRKYAEYFIVELDQCATDMLEAVEKSYQYLQTLK